jgi:hypothetical protein
MKHVAATLLFDPYVRDKQADDADSKSIPTILFFYYPGKK